VNELVQLTIQDIAFGGKGVARHEGLVVFVPFVAPGERVTARIVRRKKKFAEAELVSVEEPSPDRVAAPCPVFGQCGGCSYQHLAYERQLAIKSAQVEQTLRRVGRLGDVPMQPIVGSPRDYGYRNRIRVHRSDGVVGFFAQDGRRLVDVEECALALPKVNSALKNLRRALLPDGDYSLRAPGGGPYFEQTNPQVTRELVALVERTVRRGQQLLVDAYCGAGLFARALRNHFEQVVGLEENELAVETATRDAAAHERYLAGDVSEHLGELLGSHDAGRTTVVLDPPGTGISPRVSDLLIAGAPSEIVYVSCNPATLARDLANLAKSFRLLSVTPVDMFPQTAEIEVVVHLIAGNP
jgi:tRNA/tmRNA/rRNA uracil-C5-methylase (TrmA/RlmC/RlmD family)